MKTFVTTQALLHCTDSSRNVHFLVSASPPEEDYIPLHSCEAAQTCGWQAGRAVASRFFFFS